MSDTNKQAKPVSAIRLALLAQKLRDDLNYLRGEPIAIIGMSCRFPGGANSPSKYWDLLINKTDAISEIPADRWDVEALYDPELGVPGKINTRWAGFLDQIDQFDPAFFGISPREARAMDPQQRLFLEVSYEAIENAGLTFADLNNSQTGVFATSYHNDYAQLQHSKPEQIDGHTLTGTLHSIVPNRLSYFLNLRGPSISIDTACSSSLVAVHMACQSLHNDECDIALAGGVSLIIAPDVMVSLSKVGFLAPDGRCRTFDAEASGFSRGEGCGVIILKRLSDALAHGDTILAVIRGSAVNQDGHSNVLTAPNGLAQKEVVRQAISNAGISPDQISYVEAHGTGTPLGDPIEVEALAEVIGHRPEHPFNPCVLASVKTNFGHLEAAAGIAGVIKVVLSLQHEAIPPHLHFKKLNPHITLEGTPFVIPAETFPWPRNQNGRFAGISSFGVGGTNAHVILEEAPQLPSPEQKLITPRPYLLPLSAHNPEALQMLAMAYQGLLSGQTQNPLEDICYTASVHRNHHGHRMAVIGQTAEEMVEKLKAFQQKKSSANDFTDNDVSSGRQKLVFVFSGQGQQWWAMGRELMVSETVFRETIEQCTSLFSDYADWSLATELMAAEEDSRLEQTEIAQPAIFAIQVALTALWRSWGITPDAVIGHSVGEVAAAYAANAIRLEDAVRIVFHRARLMQKSTGLGKMVVIEQPRAEVEKLIAEYSDSLSIAAVNSPTSIVFSGATQEMDFVLESLQRQGRSTQVLQANYAFHSPQMDAYQAGLTESLQGLSPTRASIPIYSTVTGKKISAEEMNAAYWSRNIREPVNFAAGMEALINDDYHVFLEIGAHPVLGSYIAQILKHRSQKGTVLPSLRRKKPDLKTILTSLGELYRLGYSIAWKQIYPSAGRRVDLPSYPWQHKRYWIDSTKSTAASSSISRAGQHPLLGQRLRSPEIKNLILEAQLGTDSPSFLNDHRIFGNAILPATAYLEMALAAAANILGREAYRLQDVVIQEALSLSNDELRTVQLVLDGDKSSFKIFSLNGDTEEWTLHASGKIQNDQAASEKSTFVIKDIQVELREVVTADEHYQGMLGQGNNFGPGFQGVQKIWRNPEKSKALAQVQLPEGLTPEFDLYQFHPALMDACLQALTAILPSDSNVYLPIGLEGLRLYSQPRMQLWSFVQLRERNDVNNEILIADFWVMTDDGRLVAELSGLRVKRATLEALSNITRKHSDRAQQIGLYEIIWKPRPLAVSSTGLGQVGDWLVFADKDGLGIKLANLLQDHGHSCVLVHPGESLCAIDENSWEINPSVPSDFPKLIRESLPHSNRKWQGVIHLWSLDAPSIAEGEMIPQDSLAVATSSVLHLVQTMAQAKESSHSKLWLVTRGAQPINGETVALVQAPLWGLANTIALEHPELACVRIDLAPVLSSADSSFLVEELLSENKEEDQIGYREGMRYVARLRESNLDSSSALHEADTKESSIQPTRLAISAPGTLDALELRPAFRHTPKPGEIEIQVQATGLNFRDILKTLGIYPGDPGRLGDECAGAVISVGSGVENFRIGDQVLAVAAGSFNTFVTTSAELAIHRPASLSVDEAATIPIAFLTAHYALNHLAHIKAGDKVLIHAAAGGVGLAAVQLTRRAGAEIFGTAGSPEKRDYLRSIGVQHVMDSRSLGFAEEIMEITGGQGVDVILNSLAGEFIPKSLSILSEKGCFLEIGKTNIWDKSEVAALKPNVSYFTIYLGDQFDHDPSLIQSMLREILSGFEFGELSPLPQKVFPLEDVREAFRYMAQAKHIGKVIITHPQAAKASTPAHPLIRPDATYLITGGLGGLGLVMAWWLKEQGAKHIVLLGRSTISDTARQAIKELEGETKLQIAVKQGDVSNQADVARLLEEISQNMPPLKGILHAAGIVDDGILLQQDFDRFLKVMAPKIMGAWNLHSLTRNTGLDFFIMFSSIASIFGSTAQGNYAAANSFLDALAHHRRAQGLPALSVNWGAWNDLGMTAALNGRDQLRWARHGIDGIFPEQGTKALNSLLHKASMPQAALISIRWDAFLAASPSSPFFSDMAQKYKVQRRVQSSQPASGFLPEFRNTPATRQQNMLRTYLREQTRQILGLETTESIDLNQPLRELGLDSLMAVELRNALSASMNTDLPATLLFDYPTLTALSHYLISQVLTKEITKSADSLPDQKAETTYPSTTLNKSIDVEKLSEEEAEALLLAELDHKSDNGAKQ